MRYLPCVAKRWRFQCNMKCCGRLICITWSTLPSHKALVRGEVRSCACGLLLRLSSNRLQGGCTIQPISDLAVASAQALEMYAFERGLKRSAQALGAKPSCAFVDGPESVQ